MKWIFVSILCIGSLSNCIQGIGIAFGWWQLDINRVAVHAYGADAAVGVFLAYLIATNFRPFTKK